jgi:plasmid stabilization system protein ParE
LKLPFSSAPRSYLRQNLRVLFCEQYAIYYLPRPDEIIVVRVLHGSRDIASIADEGGFAI